MKWLKLKELHCIVPNNSETKDKVMLQVGNRKLSLGKMTYDQKLDLKKYGKIRFEAETSLKLWDMRVFGKNTLLGKYIAREKEANNIDDELYFRNLGEYRLAYKISFKNGRHNFKLVQLDCLRTASGFSQEKVYFMFNKKKFQTKFVVKQNKHYNLSKYSSINFGEKLEIKLFTSELLKSDKLIGKYILSFQISSRGESEIVFDRDSCLYHLNVEVFDLSVKV